MSAALRNPKTLAQKCLFQRMSISTYTSLVIEQVNAIASPKDAKYQIVKGNLTFNQFILSYPSGAYTGMRTVHRDAIVEFNTHVKRITNSVSHMSFGSEPNNEKVQQAMASFRDPKQFEAKVLPLLKKGLETYYDQVDTTTHSSHPFEAKISIMVTYSLEKEIPLFAAHFAQLPSIPSGKRVRVEIEKKERKAPEVKDSQWVRDRSQLEKNKAKDVNEVILMDDKDQLYEGMASNFLAVKLVDDKPVVMCASLDHILLGSILKIVISICEKHNIKLEWSFPKFQDAVDGKWIGCFITSNYLYCVLELLLPIETIYYHDESIEFKESAPIIEFLRSEVSKEIYNSASKIL
ncbi:hypothetical protein HPULCUR_002969 [Helicostylum pulchrum]|uniref:Uncharacterized protein n=1 Tax=Helicostylum pulchrum TaxID=562976 RepID=A0ABP9XS50_9FUNG